MTGEPLADLSEQDRRRQILRGGLRSLVTVVVLVTLYYVLPLHRKLDTSVIMELVAGLAGLLVVLGWQLRVIARNDNPGVRAIEALSFSIPLFLLLFSATYFLMAAAQPTNFTQPLTRTDALYFCVTVFTTVGFGDITANSEAARLVVTVQMLLDLAVLGLVIKAVLNAVKRSQERHASKTPA